MLVVSLAAITKQRTALVQTDAGPKCYAASLLFGARFFRIAMLNCCSASSIMCEYPALRIFSRSRAFLSLLISLRASDRVSSLKSTSGFWRYQTISSPRYSDHPSVGNLDAAEIEARNDCSTVCSFSSNCLTASARSSGRALCPHFAQNCQLLVPTKLLSSIFDTYFLCGKCQLFSGQDNALVAAVGWQKIKGA